MKNHFKTLVVFTYMFNLYLLSGFAQTPQEYGYLVAHIIDTNTVTRSGEQLINNENNLNDVFETFNVFSYKYAYPKVKSAYLRKFAAIECYCNVEELAAFLEENYSHYFSDIEYAHDSGTPNYDPSDPLWYETEPDGTPKLWHLKIIEADKAWDITKGSPDISIAIIDGGFDISHPDLVNKILDTVDSFTGLPFVYNALYHGTTVASFAGAETDGGGQLASVGFNTMLRFYDVLGDMEVDLAYDASFEKGADVISYTTLKSGIPSLRKELLVKEILDNNTVIVRSAGNRPDNNDSQAYPFSHSVDNRIIIVTSTDKNDQHGGRHARFPEVSICAPGHNVMGADGYDNGNNPYPYKTSGGTSFATPIVAGVCALLKSINKNLTPEEIKYIIQATADPIADAYLYPGCVGAGRVNAYKAVLAARCYSGLPIVQGTITQNTVWNTLLHAVGTIIVPSNVTLTITSTVKCDSETSIIIHPGGKLVIEGGTLTSACEGELWRGITVIGDSTQSSISPSQSYITLVNGATIENAATGIHATKGGVVVARNTHFVNNTIAVQIDPVVTSHAGISAEFVNTHFSINDNYPGNISDFEAHLKLSGCRGVEVRGCEFLNETTHTSYPTGNNNGVLAFNAPLVIREFCPQTAFTHPVTGLCDPTALTPNFFSGFNKAIAASNSGTTPTLKVRYTTFKNNLCGIEIAGINNHELIRNEFSLTQHNSYGVNVSNSTGYKIEENEFNASLWAPWSGVGLKIANSGGAENEVYKNHYNGLYTAQQFMKINSLGIEYDVPHFTGLQTLCNRFENNGYSDILVGLMPLELGIAELHLIRPTQGSTQKSAGNLFYGTPNFNINNQQSQHHISYYYNPFLSNEFPNYISNVTRYPASSNSCPSKIGTGGGQQTKGGENIEQLLAQYDEWDAMYEYWLAKLLAFEGGEDEEEYEMLLNNVSYYSALKDNYFNWVIVSAFENEVGGLRYEVSGGEGEKEKGEKEKGEISPAGGGRGWTNYETLRFLFAYRGHYIDYLSITETHLAENNYAEALHILAKMYNQFEITEEQLLELKSMETYILWLQQLSEEEKIIYNLPENEINHLINYVETNTGRGAVFAKNILCGLYGICIEDEVGGVWYEVSGDDEMMRGLDDEMINNLRESVSSASSACQKALENITLYPNPTTGELEIKNYELEIKSIEVFDVYGRKVSSHHLITSSSNHLINISHLNSGIYFVKIVTEAGEVVKKVIKQ